MSHDEDDYLSEKFLLNDASTSSRPKSYAEIRKEAKQKSLLKNEQNRIKSRRQRELESREVGLSKSLFERAKEEEQAGLSSGNKALQMMMKMGFKPGQSLGRVEEKASPPSPPETPDRSESPEQPDVGGSDSAEQRPLRGYGLQHRIEPLPLAEWTGKKGIGLGKRARSPTIAERVAKMAKMADESSHRDFRNRARQEYEERRADGRLGPAQRTCGTLDERAGKAFNVLWLNPSNTGAFPPGLAEALAIRSPTGLAPERSDEPLKIRLRKQMQADALQPLGDLEECTENLSVSLTEQISPDTVEEAMQFLRLQAQDRLELVLTYLRDNYAYCFWCGVEYSNDEQMENQCPGPNEEDHD